MSEELRGIKEKCATGEPLTEGQARWLVGALMEARQEQDRLLGVIRQIQWCGLTPDEVEMCPLCDQVEPRGHAPDCPIGAALEAGE